MGPLTSIGTGAEVPEFRETEVWFDQTRALKKTVERVDGRVMSELLETPEGGLSGSGPLITCAWIARHPREATRLRVSCNSDMENGLTPRAIPETPPTVHPAISGFIDGYREALASGRASEVERGFIAGHEVIWLRFSSQPDVGAPTSQDVAVDASTYRPVQLRSGDGSWEADVLVAETVPYNSDLFRRPAQTRPEPAAGSIRAEATISFSEARQVLGERPLSLGSEWRGMRLANVSRLELVTGYGPVSDSEPRHSNAVRVTYRLTEGHSDSMIEISQARNCEMALLWPCGRGDVGEGQIRSHVLPGTGLARVAGLYVTVRVIGSDHSPLSVVRALTAS